MKTVWKKDGDCLKPADPKAEQFLSKTHDRCSVLMNARRPRNLKHHNKFYALVDVTLDNMPRQKTGDARERCDVRRAGAVQNHQV